MHEIDNFELVEAKGEEYDTPSHPPSSPVLEMLQTTGNHLFFESMHEIDNSKLVEAMGEEYDCHNPVHSHRAQTFPMVYIV